MAQLQSRVRGLCERRFEERQLYQTRGPLHSTCFRVALHRWAKLYRACSEVPWRGCGLWMRSGPLGRRLVPNDILWLHIKRFCFDSSSHRRHVGLEFFPSRSNVGSYILSQPHGGALTVLGFIALPHIGCLSGFLYSLG